MFSEHEPHARRYMDLAESHAALEAENTRLRAEVGRLRTTIRIARQRLYDSHGRDISTTYRVIMAVGEILRREYPSDES